MTKSAKEYIEENDFEGAKQRFDNATARWHVHWFNTCKAIFEKSAEWSQKYILDPIKMTIITLIDYIFNRNYNSYVYFVKLLDRNYKPICLKIGKANCVDSRLSDYVRKSANYYGYEIIKSWKLPSEKDAESFEHRLQARVLDSLVSDAVNIPRDRFELFEVTENLLDKMDKIYKNYLAGIEHDVLA